MLLSQAEYDGCCTPGSRLSYAQLVDLMEDPENLETDDESSDEEEAAIIEAEHEVD